MELREILNLLDVERKISETSYQCRCPHHFDSRASMTVTEKDGRILVYCHAGCETEDILEDIGLTMGDLTVKPAAAEDFGGEPWQRGLEAVYDYFNEAGEYRYSKLRYRGKRIFNGVIERGRGCDFKAVPKDRHLYRLPQLIEHTEKKPGEPVYIVEGEKDADTLAKMGLAATTAGGANQWRRDFAKYFKSARVVILPDNDGPGKELAERIVKDIKGICHAYKVVGTSTAEHGDVTDYMGEGYGKEDLLDLVEAEPWTTGEGRQRARIESYTAESLAKTEFPEIFFVADGLLPAGSAILAAPAKTGKSWMMMQLAIAAASGGHFLGRKASKCHVAYFALEDSPRRLQDRLKKMLAGKDPPEGITFITRAPRIEDGLLADIERMVGEDPDIRLVIIDTLQKVKPPSSKTQTAYEQDYGILGDVTDLAHRKGFCFLLLHHLKKSSGFNVDPFEKILGSTALQGSTDTMAVMEREKRTEDEAVLHVTGRDIPPQDLALAFNNYRWESMGDAGSIERMRAELAYRNHPVTVTLKKKLAEIEAEGGEPVKEYVARAKDFREDVIKETGQVVGTSERNFMTIAKGFDIYLLKDGIEHIEPEPNRNTLHKGKRGRFHRYHYVKEKSQ